MYNNCWIYKRQLEIKLGTTFKKSTKINPKLDLIQDKEKQELTSQRGNFWTRKIID